MDVQPVPLAPGAPVGPDPAHRTFDSAQTLVLAFGAPGSAARDDLERSLAAAFPLARVVGCSADAASATAIRFRHVGLRVAQAGLPAGSDGVRAAEALLREVTRTGPDEAAPALVLAFVRRAADDVDEVIAALRGAVPPTTALAGASASGTDGAWVLGAPDGDAIVAVALHGRDLEVHQRLGTHPPGPPRDGAVSVGFSAGARSLPIGAGGVVPLHRLAEGPGPTDVVVTTLAERGGEGRDGEIFEDVETQVTEIPVRRTLDGRFAWAAGSWSPPVPVAGDGERTLVLARAEPALGPESSPLPQIGELLPRSHVVAWSDAAVPGGAALSAQLRRFERVTIRTASAPLGDDPEGAARQVHAALAAPDLALVLGVLVGRDADDPRALAVAAAPVPVLTVVAAGDAPFGWAGGRLGAARWIGVGVYRAEAPGLTIAGADPVEAFWRAADRLDRLPPHEADARPTDGGRAPVASENRPTPNAAADEGPPARAVPLPVPSPNTATRFATPIPAPPDLPLRGRSGPPAPELELAERQRPTGAAFDLRVRDGGPEAGPSVVTVSGALDRGLDDALDAGLLDRLGPIVLVDLDGVEAIDEAGATAWGRLAQAVVGRGGALYVARCSEAATSGLRFTRGERVVSLFVPYRCPCGTAFSALHVRTAAARLTRPVPCPACGAAVPPDGFDPAGLGVEAGALPAAVADAVAGLPRREAPELARPIPPAPAAEDGALRISPKLGAAAVAALLAAVGFAVVVVAGALALRWALSSAAPSASAPVLPPLTAVGEDRGALPPPWVEARLTVTDTTVLAVGRGAADDTAGALELARTDALSALLDGVAEDLGDAPAGRIVAGAAPLPRTPDATARAIARFEAQLRAVGVPAPTRERTWIASGGAELAVRYAVDRAAWDRLVAAYGETATWRTFDVAVLFPTFGAQLPVGDAELVVVRVDDGEHLVRVGDVVDAVGGRPVRSVAGFRDAIDADWRDGTATVGVISNGLPRELRFTRKAAPAAPVRQGRSLSSPR